MQDLFMYFYQDNCDLNDGNYWWNIIKRDHVSANHYAVCMFYCIGIYNKHLSSTAKIENR